MCICRYAAHPLPSGWNWTEYDLENEASTWYGSMYVARQACFFPMKGSDGLYEPYAGHALDVCACGLNWDTIISEGGLAELARWLTNRRTCAQ